MFSCLLHHVHWNTTFLIPTHPTQWILQVNRCETGKWQTRCTAIGHSRIRSYIKHGNFVKLKWISTVFVRRHCRLQTLQLRWQMNESLRKIGAMTLTDEKRRSTQSKACPSATFHHKPCFGSNPGLYCDTPGTNQLFH
jgi:hypothetical protein